VVNQWGRDGNFSSSGSRSSGGAGIIIAAVVALLLGAGGGYTGARLMGGASSGDLKARDARIADLEKQVSDLKFTTSGNADQENALREHVKELTKANETLKALVDENDGQTSASAQAEIAALKKTIEEAGNLRTELNRARRSQQVSELQIIELEGEIKSQRTELDKLRKSLTDAANQGDAGNKALSDQIKTLEAALADSRKQASAAADLRKQIATLEDDVAQKTAELNTTRKSTASLQKDIDRARAELTKVKKELAAARAVIKDSGGESEALQKELAAAEEQLAARDGDVRTLEARLKSLKSDLDAANSKASRADADKILMGMNLRAARADKEKLETEVAVLKQTIETLKAAQTPDKTEPDVTSGGDDTPAVRRDADDVRDALEDMPGFGRLTPDKQIELARRLEDGECAADALKTTLGRVPAIALRNLIRDLGSKC
jgi:DNA repair exonuclease SbcCD ATPase subunit